MKALSAARSVCRIETLIFGTALWTISYWLTLLFGLGWAVALAMFVGLSGSAALAGRGFEFGAGPARRAAPTEIGAIGMILVIVLLWPILADLGRPTLTVLVVGLGVIRLAVPLITRRFERSDARAMFLAGLVGIAGVCYWAGWTAVVIFLVLLAVATTAWPDWFVTVFGNDRQIETPTMNRAGRAATPLLAAFGTLIAVWFMGVAFWLPDNHYYLNKVSNYSADAFVFEARDYLFGFDGLSHVPFGNVLSAYEPFAGLLAAITPLSPAESLFQTVAPLAMFLIPFSSRFAAHNLGMRRPHLVGAFAAAVVLLMSGPSTSDLPFIGAYGKFVGAVIFVPLLIGACGRLVKFHDAPSAILALAAATATIGMSPSLSLAAIVLTGSFAVAGLVQHWTSARGSSPARTYLQVVPLVAMLTFAVVARMLQATTDQLTGATVRFQSPVDAWEYGTVSVGSTETTVTMALLLGGVAAFPLALGNNTQRRAAGILLAGTFGVIFAPWSFDVVISDVLNLNFFAWRFAWVLPVAFVIGMLLGSLDDRPRAGLLTAAAATLALALAGPILATSTMRSLNAIGAPAVVDIRVAPLAWPWDARIPEPFIVAASEIAEATPVGGRYLAPVRLEEMAGALYIDRYPTTGRTIHLEAAARTANAPSDLYADERLMLRAGFGSRSDSLTVQEWRDLLSLIEVATVCTPPDLTPALAEAVATDYTEQPSTNLFCRIHIRTAPFDR